MNGTNFIGDDNDYCSKAFENKALYYLQDYGFSASYGVRSDCDEISEHINCFNISVGYYNAHTDKEYVNLDEFENTYKALVFLIENFNEKLPKPEKYDYKYSSKKYSHSIYYPYEDDAVYVE